MKDQVKVIMHCNLVYFF